EVDGLDVHRVGGRYTFSLAAPIYYRRSLRQHGFDLVVEDLNKVPLFTPYWGRFPLVLLVHHLFGRTAFEEAPLPLAAATWLLERPLPWVYRGVPVEAVSPSTADDLVARGFRRDRIVVIPNGVDLDWYRPGEEPRFEQPTLLYLGRLKRYKRAWVHVLTSPKEGRGITNLQAAASGTPTVASDSPGVRDAVVDGSSGCLVPHGDVEALADRLTRLLTDAGLRERLGREARAFAERFSWDRAAEQTEAHLEQVLESWKRSGRGSADAA